MVHVRSIFKMELKQGFGNSESAPIASGYPAARGAAASACLPGTITPADR